MKRVKGPNDVPNAPHFAVIIYGTRSVWVPGDERSRTNPGHGYPEHTDRFDDIEHWVTTEREVLDAFVNIQEMATGSEKKPYVVIDKAYHAEHDYIDLEPAEEPSRKGIPTRYDRKWVI